MQHNFFCFILGCVLYHPPCFRFICLYNCNVLLPCFFLMMTMMCQSHLSFSAEFHSPPRKIVYDCKYCLEFLLRVSPPVCYLLTFSHCYLSFHFLTCGLCIIVVIHFCWLAMISVLLLIYISPSITLLVVLHRACIFFFFGILFAIFPSIVICLISSLVFPYFLSLPFCVAQLVACRTLPSCFLASLFGDFICIFSNFCFFTFYSTSCSCFTLCCHLVDTPTSL